MFDVEKLGLIRFTAKRTTIEKVKEAMFTEVDMDNTINPIFVYATDEALNEAPLHLSGALQVSLTTERAILF